MSGSTSDSSQEIWKGRPWILPDTIIRTVLVAVIAVIVLLVENSIGILYQYQVGLPVLYWTLIVFFLAWIMALFGLLVLRTTNFYILREDSLEIKFGLFTTKTSMIVPTGFSDLEVIRSISSRIVNTGDIVVKTQSEREFTKIMVKVRDPMKVANLIRNVMARPIIKFDEYSSGKNN
jgi:hypothetical protein